jgi:L-malate glycosyltransferase
VKILMACSWGNRASTGGAGSFFFDQAKSLQDLGHEVELLFTTYIFGMRNPIQSDESIDMDGLRCHFVEAKSFVPRKAAWNVPFHGYQLFSKVLKRGIRKPDFVICQSMMELSQLGGLLEKKWNVPTVFIEHHSAFTSKGFFSEPKTLPKRIKQVEKSGLKIFAVSEFLRTELRDFRGMAKVQRVFNPVPYDLKQIEFSPPPSDEFVFIIIGRNDHNKRISLAIEAFQKFKSIGGKGKLQVITECVKDSRLLKDESLRDCILLDYSYGRLSRMEIFERIQNAHAMVSCSLFETFGMTILEALALGRPVITNDSGGPRDLISESNGIIDAFDTPNELASAMLQLEKQYSSFDLKEISRKTREEFSIENWFRLLSC